MVLTSETLEMEEEEHEETAENGHIPARVQSVIEQKLTHFTVRYSHFLAVEINQI